MTLLRRRLISATITALTTIAAVGAAALTTQTPVQTPAPPAAPAALAPADATSLLGDWTIAAEGQNGPAKFLLTLKVTEGKVVGEMSSEAMPKTSISDITKRDKSVVLQYSFDYQGTLVATIVTLTPDGENLSVVFDFANGAYTMNGKATKKK